MADLGLDGEVVGLHMGRQHRDRPETAKRPIPHRRTCLGNLGNEQRQRQKGP